MEISALPTSVLSATVDPAGSLWAVQNYTSPLEVVKVPRHIWAN